MSKNQFTLVTGERDGARVTINRHALKAQMERCARMFGGSAYCATAREYHSGWAFLIVAYDDDDDAYVDIHEFPGTGPRPEDPVVVATELLGLSDSVVAGLGKLDMHWGLRKEDGSTLYVLHAPLRVPAGGDLQAIIARIAQENPIPDPLRLV